MVEADAVDNVEVEPSFDDPEDFIDEIDDAEIVGDVLRQEPSIEEYENYSLLLFGLPIVNKDKFPKLRNVITKILDGISPAGHSEEYPIDEATGMSKGTAFIEWPDADTAAHAKAVLDKYALDKNHTFSAILFSEVKKVTKPDDDWKPPEPQKYNDVGDLWSWMQNTRCRDQFAVHYHKNGSANVSVYWNIKGHEPQLVNDHADKQGWTETYFDWSPYGSYLATIHRQGVALWGGETFQKFQRFAHENVHYIDFSPKETYLVTFAFTEDKWNDDSEVLRIWDVVTGELKRSFSLYALTNRNELSGWPFFQWSQDEKYFACLKKPEKDKLEKEKRISGITVFSSETMAPLDKKGITVEGIRQFKWSPASNMIGYYSESSADLPAELGVVSVPVVANNRSRSSRIYNVGEANLYWQKSGAHLAVHTLRYNKKALKDNGEVKYIGGCKSHIEIFEVESKDISVQTLELAEPFIDFGWEPTGAQGDKFCVLVGTNNKAMPLVYKLDKTKHTPMLISKLEAGVQLNTVAWAPAGGWLVVYSARSTGGNVAFIDTNGTEAKRTNLAEHPGFNKGYWDPTGRYFVTCSTSGGRLGADLGYRLYTFQGRELVRKNLDKLSQFKWRPRPPVKLSEEKQKEIRKNLKTIAQRFEKEDNEERVKASQEVVDKRRKIMAAFELIRKRNLEEYKKLREKRFELRDGVDTEAELLTDDLVEEKITVALSTQKIAVEAADDEE